MARPPKNAEGPSATERMEMAFWDCLKEKPYSDIVVRDIVNRAKVNRNSYYYHYDSMWDLAQASVRHAKFTDLARLLMSQKTFNPDNPVREFSDDARHGFDILRILSSENGNQRLLEDAKEAITEEWLAMFGCENVLISKRTESEIDFVFGGITAMLAAPHLKTLDDLVMCIASSELLLETIKMMRQIIRACEPETIQKAVTALHPTHEIEDEQEPSETGSSDGATKEPVESIVERIIEEEMKSEELWEEEPPADSEPEREPVKEEKTQQKTEGRNEAVSTQTRELEQESEVDVASEESIDAVPSDDEAQEIAAVAGYGQEPVERVAAEALAVTAIEVETTIETTRIEEIVIEEAAALQAEFQAEEAPLPEPEPEPEIEPEAAPEEAPAKQEEPEPEAPEAAADDDEDEPQLTLDIFM